MSPSHRGRQGHPVIFSRRFYKDIMHIKGDIGARDIVNENPDCVLRVEVENEDCFFDIDTEEDLHWFSERQKNRETK